MDKPKKKNEPVLIRGLPQVGTSALRSDALRDALRPGKRKSQTGKIYWETRKNRSDQKGKKV